MHTVETYHRNYEIQIQMRALNEQEVKNHESELGHINNKNPDVQSWGQF